MTTESQGSASRTVKAKLFRGLADASRLAVLECLVAQPMCVSDVVAATGLSQPNVSNHLACLRDCGLVEREQRGRFAFYRLADTRVAGILADIERIVAPIQAKLEACPNY